MPAFFLITLRGGFRAHSTRLVLFSVIAVLCLAWLAGSFSPRQPLTVAFDAGFSLLRIVAALLALIWVQEFVAREIDRKTVMWACANPVSRAEYVLGKFLAIALMLALALALMAALLLANVAAVAPNYHQSRPLALGMPVFAVFFYLWLDLLVVLAFGVLLALLASSPLLPLLGGLAFAVVARGLGPTLAYVRAENSAAAGWEGTLGAMQWLLPDLSRYDIREAVLYGRWPPDEQLLFVPLQALAYVVILMFVAQRFFARREFE